MLSPTTPAKVASGCARPANGFKSTIGAALENAAVDHHIGRGRTVGAKATTTAARNTICDEMVLW